MLRTLNLRSTLSTFWSEFCIVKASTVVEQTPELAFPHCSSSQISTFIVPSLQPLLQLVTWLGLSSPQWTVLYLQMVPALGQISLSALTLAPGPHGIIKTLHPPKAHMSEDNGSIILHIKACCSDGRPAGENFQTWSFFMDILRFCNVPLTPGVGLRQTVSEGSPTAFKPLQGEVQFSGFQALLPLQGAQLTRGSIRWYWAQAGIVAQSLCSVWLMCQASLVG